MPKVKTRTISDAISEFLLDRQIEGRSPFTVEFYRQRLRGFRVFIGAESPVESMTIATLRHYLVATNDGHPDAHRCRYTALRAFCNWCVRQRYLIETPLTISVPKLPWNTVPILSLDDISKLLLACDGVMADRDRAMVLFLVDAGIRVGELSNICIEDIDFHTRLVKIQGKGARERQVVIGFTVLKMILKLIDGRTSGHVWFSEHRTPLTRSGIEQMFRHIKRKAGLTKRTSPHTFRHTFANNFLEAGGQELELQYLLGHSSLTMVERYSRATKARRALKAQERFSPVDRLGLK